MGAIRDYYIDGRLQMEADSIVSEDQETYHGEVRYYTEEGRVHLVQSYINGVLDTLRTIEIFESLISKYKVEIPGHLDLAPTANDLAYLYREQKAYEKAKDLYELSLNIRVDRLGKNNLLVAHSSSKLGWVLIKLDELSEAEELFLTSLRIYDQELGKSSDWYLTSKDHLNWIYESTGKDRIEK